MAKKNNNSNSQIQYWLDKIQILKFNLSEIEGLNYEKDKIIMLLNLSGNHSEKDGNVEITTNIKIEKEISEIDNIEIAELKVRITFGVRNVDVLGDDGIIYLPKNLINTFNTISISTTRGILFTKFQGTNIDDFILPLIDSKHLDDVFKNVSNVELVD